MRFTSKRNILFFLFSTILSFLRNLKERHKMGAMKNIFVGLILVLSIKVFGQTVPTNLSPINTLETTKVFFQFSHSSGNVYYDLEVDTSPNFNSTLLRTNVGTVDYSSTNNGSTITDSISNLHYGKQYYWRSRSRTVGGVSAWSSAVEFTTINAPQIIGPMNEATVAPSNFYVWSTHKEGNSEYIIEASVESGFNYPIYYRESSLVFVLNPTIEDGVVFSTKINGLPSSGVIYIRMMSKNEKDSSDWSETVKVYLAEDVGIPMLHEDSKILYPNPSNGILYFQENLQYDSFKVFDVNGKLIADYPTLNGMNHIDLSNVPAGLYFVQMKVGDVVLHQKIRISSNR